MKKLTLILLSIVMIVALAACGDKKCDHAYDNACDVTCNECGEERTITHDWNDATCLTPKTCEVCGATEGEALGHTPNDDDGDCTTAITCKVCGDVVESGKASHTSNADDGDCTTAITCKDCGTVTTTGKASHTPNADDGDCTTAITCTDCGKVTTAAKTAHTPGADDNDCSTAVTCTDCGKVTTEAKAHDFSGAWQKDASGHWHVCSNAGCTKTDTVAGHSSNGPATETKAEKCSVCEYVIAPELEHTHVHNIPQYDDTNHWLECACGDKASVTAHTANADDGDCTTAITCSVCGTTTTPAKDSHTGGTATCTEKAVCTACGTAYGAIDVNNHIDENTDHICDRECGKTDIGTHADSAEDNDHVCDYGCGATLEEHKGGTATCVAQKVCTICGNGYGDLENHDFGSGNTCICGAEIAFTGFIYISDEIYTYDESTNTYTVIIPPNYYGADAKFHITGKNLEYLESDNALLKVKENHSLVGEYDFLLEDFLNTGFEVGWGSMRDGSWLEYQYSNDGGITWSKAVRAEVKQSYYVTVNASENGTVTANEYAIEGETVTLNVFPAEGYMLDTLSVTDASGNTIVVENNQFTMPASAVIVNATFAVCDHKDSRHETATDNGDGTHSFTCTVCGVTGTENHTIENHVCTSCGAMEIVVSFDADDYEWKTGDELYFCRVSRDNQWEEYCFTATVAEDGTVTWTPDKTLYWDGTGEHRLIVSYPANMGLGWDDFVIPGDQSTPELLREADHMNARWVGTPTTNVIEFELKHRMAKITVNYTIASQFDPDAPVIAEIYSNAMYCIFSDADGLPIITSVGRYDTWIIPYHNDNQFIAYVAPGEYNTDGMFKFYIGDAEVQIKIANPGAVTLEEGGEYTFDVKVGQDVLTIVEVSMGDIDSPFGDGWHNEIDLKAIGTQDVGKTAWEEGDRIIVTFTSPSFGTQFGILTYEDAVWSTDVSFSYLEDETPTVSAIYAPCYEVVDGNMQLNDGLQLGMTEYILAACSVTDGILNISFDGAIRNYSRLRIFALPGQTLTVTTTDFTPAGATKAATEAYTLIADENGNVYLYGTFAEGATINVKQGEVTLADYTLTANNNPNGTEHNKSYALDARPIIDGTLGGKTEATEEDVNALVEQLKAYVNNGITTIIVTGSNPAIIEVDGIVMPAVSEAIYRLSKEESYNGKIDLILPDVTEIVDKEFYDAFALNSITLPKVTKIGDMAFQGCYYLKQLTFGSVLTEIVETGGGMFSMVGQEVGNCDLVLNCGQMNGTSIPDLTANTWTIRFTYEFKSITLTHTGENSECDECKAQ